ncbi:MAG: nucleotidyltransferase domain-containing protein [Candidatus Hydrogenedentota bacterium]
MNNGLDERTIEQIRSVLSCFKSIKKVVLYGSRSKGNFKKGSDIDLALYGKELTSKTVNEIADRLDDLLLPYKFDLTIVSSITNPDLIDHINRVGIVLYPVSEKIGS